MFNFEQFPVYIKSEQVYQKLGEIFANKSISLALKDQLRRAASSIALNIAEGAGKFHKNDKKNFYLIARGSTNECVAILRLLKIENRISENLFKSIYADLTEIGKMLSGLINKMLA
jgi:four helix bundle protein